MDLKFLAIGLMALGMAGAALGVGLIFNSVVSATARNPSASDTIQAQGILGAVFAELMGLLSFVIAIILIYT